MLPAKGPRPHPYYDLPDGFVEVAFVDAQGVGRRVRVRHKTIGDGPPLVLVHGLMTSSYSWRYVIDGLSRRYRVFAPDLVGSGKTDKPGDLVYSVANIARFLTWMDDASHFLQVDAPERTVEQIVSFDREAA